MRRESVQSITAINVSMRGFQFAAKDELERYHACNSILIIYSNMSPTDIGYIRISRRKKRHAFRVSLEADKSVLCATFEMHPHTSLLVSSPRPEDSAVYKAKLRHRLLCNVMHIIYLSSGVSSTVMLRKAKADTITNTSPPMVESAFTSHSR